MTMTMTATKPVSPSSKMTKSASSSSSSSSGSLYYGKMMELMESVMKPKLPNQLKGHRKRITAMAASNQFLFSGAKDKTIRVWDMDTLRVRTSLRGHQGPITSLIVVDNILYSASTDGTVRTWSLITMQPLATSGSVLSDVAIHSMVVDKSSSSVFVGCSDGVIRSLDAMQLTSKGSVRGHSNWVSSLVVYKGVLISGSVDAAIKLWDTDSLMSVGCLMGHTGFITSLSVSDDRLFSGSFDGSVRVWDLPTLSEVTVFTLSWHPAAVRSVTIASGNLYVCYATDSVRVISLSTLEDICEIEAKPVGFDNSMTVSDGKLFLASAGKTINVHVL